MPRAIPGVKKNLIIVLKKPLSHGNSSETASCKVSLRRFRVYFETLQLYTGDDFEFNSMNSYLKGHLSINL